VETTDDCRREERVKIHDHGRVRVIDLEHDGVAGAIGATVILGPEPVLVDPGPASTVERLEEGMAALGVPPKELRHLFLTHIHLDHAGAVGTLARRHPRLTVHVHEDGAPHLVDPERLVASTRRTFGEDHDRLWGEVVPLPAHRLQVWRPGEGRGLGWFRGIPTPGHIDHHLGWLDEDDGTLVAGDALGIILDPAAPVHPPTPPPAVDLSAWLQSLLEVVAVGPERGVATHFGVHEDPVSRARELDGALRSLAGRVRRALEAGRADGDARDYDEEVRERVGAAVGAGRASAYFDTFSAATDYAGARRFVERNPGWRGDELGSGEPAATPDA
jgi:glyoxylase-like metal-dependent hydrolase (beta-lactamase superfamily II)